MVIMSLLAPILFFTLLAVKNTEAAVKPIVTLEPNWNNVYAGDQVTLSCNVASAEVNNHKYSYAWYKDDTYLVSEKSETLITKVAGSEVYECSAGNGIYSDPVRLHVISKQAASRPVLTLSPNWSKVYSGDKVTLTCSLGSAEARKNNNYNYYWYKNTKHFTTGKSAEFTAIEEDSGVYTCSFNNVHSLPVQLDVVSQGPLILQTPPGVVEGDSLSLRCHSEKKYENDDIIYYYKGEKNLNIRDNILYIPNVTAEDAGNYRCGKHLKIDNKNEWKTAETFISVQDLFTTPKIEINRNNLQEGGDMTVKCDTRLNPLRPGTERQFAFYKDGRAVQEFSGSDTYRVRSAQLEDSGTYICEVKTATDTVRKRSDMISIPIRGAVVRPVVTLSPNWNHFYTWDSVTLSCNVRSVDVGSYWSVDDRWQSGKKKFYTITMTKATTGTYECSPDKNVYSHPVRLHVIDKGNPDRPVLTLSPNWGNIFENEMITMTCYNAKITQNYVWIRNGNKINGWPYQEFKISSSTTWNSGNYQCGSGTDNLSSSVTLEVIKDVYLILQAPSDVIEGDSFDLRCHSRPSFNDEVATFFFKDNENLKTTNNILHIQNVNTTMSGTYKCRKNFDTYGWLWAKTYISVRDLFTTPEIKSTQYSRYPVREGDDVTLTCDTRLNPLRENTELQFAFYRDGRTVQEFSVSNIYRVRSAQLEDSGNYTCDVMTMSDTVKKNSNVLSIQIQGNLILQAPSAVVEGDSMSLRCNNKQTYKTVKTTYFYKDDTTLYSTDDNLYISNVTKAATGKYKCQKLFTDGTKRTSAEVYISVQDLITTPKIQLDPSSLQEGDNMVVKCEASLSHPRPGTKLQFAFYRDGRTVREFSGSDTYKVQSAQLEDSGSYTCEVRTATDTVRKNSNTLSIQIRDPVSGVNITGDKEHKDFVHGEPLTLNCSAEKGTSPVFRWLHNETVVDKDSEFYQLRNNGTILYIESLQSHHAGTYKCNVSNRLPASSVKTFLINQIWEKHSTGSSVVWAVLGILALILLFAVILMFINRDKLSSFFPLLSRHHKQQNSESTFHTENPRDEGIPATEGTNNPDEIDSNQHLYGNVLSLPEENDVCYSYVDIRKKKGPANQKDELSVVYAVLQPPGTSTTTQATPERDDSADVYQNLDPKRH